jgi:hypothetical protein
MAFKKGQSGNPAGKKKTAHLETANKLQKTQQMMTEGTEFLSTVWGEVIQSMAKQAIRGSVPAAQWLRDTFIGRPSETIKHEATEEAKQALSLNYSIKK